MKEQSSATSHSISISAGGLALALLIAALLLRAPLKQLADAVGNLYYSSNSVTVKEPSGDYLDENAASEYLGINVEILNQLRESGALEGTYITFPVSKDDNNSYIELPVFSKEKLKAWMEQRFAQQTTKP